MEISKYEALIPLVEKKRKVVEEETTALLKDKPCFSMLSELGGEPEKVVVESFVALVELAVKMGRTDVLVEQYQSSVRVLKSKDIEIAGAVRDFCDIIDTIRVAFTREAESQDIAEHCNRFFLDIRNEFVSTVNVKQKS